jgi:uncharacterized Ntn-hydrolase superfamily protein
VRRIGLAVLLGLAAHGAAFATWSIVAVDTAAGRVVIASATCLPQSAFGRIGARDLRDIQAAVVPGKGGAVGQALIDTSRANQKLLFQELGKGTEPAAILKLLRQSDAAFESRQFGIVDLEGRKSGFSGKENLQRSLSVGGSAAGGIHYQIQGNILANDDVVHDAARALAETRGALPDRVMAAMDAADARGGDRRCTDGRTSMVAYLLVVEKDGRETYISVTDEQPGNPVRNLRARYEQLSPK